MTDETKKLFNAPWKADVCCEIHDKNERLICICCPGEQHIANRIARLPELYDALVRERYLGCGHCLFIFKKELLENKTFEQIMDMLISNGCPMEDGQSCVYAWELDLLKKVRDGE